MRIWKTIIRGLVVLAASLLVVSSCKAQTRIGAAQIIRIVGKVYVKQFGASSWIQATLLRRLSLGDTVKVGGGSQAYIQYFHGGGVLLRAGEICGIEQEDSSFFSRLANLFSDSQDEFFRTGRRGNEEATLFHYPRSGKILSSRPAFSWFGESGHSYEIKAIETGSGNCEERKRQMWRKPSADTILTYPDAEPILQPGHHYWIGVRKRESGDWEDAICVTVATGQERASLAQEMTRLRAGYGAGRFERIAYLLDSASLLLDRGYNAKALRTLEEATQHYPAEALLQFILASAYKVGGLHRLAHDTFRSAEVNYARKTAK